MLPKVRTTTLTLRLTPRTLPPGVRPPLSFVFSFIFLCLFRGVGALVIYHIVFCGINIIVTTLLHLIRSALAVLGNEWRSSRSFSFCLGLCVEGLGFQHDLHLPELTQIQALPTALSLA